MLYPSQHSCQYTSRHTMSGLDTIVLWDIESTAGPHGVGLAPTIAAIRSAVQGPGCKVHIAYTQVRLTKQDFDELRGVCNVRTHAVLGKAAGAPFALMEVSVDTRVIGLSHRQAN